MGPQNMAPRRDRHIDERELEALAAAGGENLRALSPEAVRDAMLHLQGCADCSHKVADYRELLARSPNVAVSESAIMRERCPKPDDVDWGEIAAGLWPELKARQLIMHAAQCDHCGPLLRAALSVDDEPSPEEAKLLAQLARPSQPAPGSIPHAIAAKRHPATGWRQILAWRFVAPALSLILIVGVIATRPLSSKPLTGPEFAEFAVDIHEQHAQGRLALDVDAQSEPVLNQWLAAKSQFSVALPASPPDPGEQRPYRLAGAKLMTVRKQNAVYISYQVPTGPAGLVVAPQALASASGGVQVDFRKVTFHYQMIHQYKVVSWSVHGLTYALVSQEGTRTQQSCMVCHSAIRDRDLSHTATPLLNANPPEAAWH